MNLILDTHIFLWTLADPEKIGKKRLLEIKRLSNRIFVSSISIAEIMIKSSIGKLKMEYDPLEYVEKSGFEFLDYTCRDAVLLKDLPFHHRDPFDRMLIIQSIANKYPIVTNDEKFTPYNCKVI